MTPQPGRYEYRVRERESLGQPIWALERRYTSSLGVTWHWDEMQVYRDPQRAENDAAELNSEALA